MIEQEIRFSRQNTLIEFKPDSAQKNFSFG